MGLFVDQVAVIVHMGVGFRRQSATAITQQVEQKCKNPALWDKRVLGTDVETPLLSDVARNITKLEKPIVKGNERECNSFIRSRSVDCSEPHLKPLPAVMAQCVRRSDCLVMETIVEETP
jgi:hypothetical protein